MHIRIGKGAKFIVGRKVCEGVFWCKDVNHPNGRSSFALSFQNRKPIEGETVTISELLYVDASIRNFEGRVQVFFTYYVFIEEEKRGRLYEADLSAKNSSKGFGGY